MRRIRVPGAEAGWPGGGAIVKRVVAASVIRAGPGAAGTRSCDSHEHGPPPATAWSSRHFEAASAYLAALGDPERLRLVALIGTGESCVSELVAATGAKTSAVSHRLNLLHRTNLLSRRRDGKHVYYRLLDDHVLGLARNALQHAGERLPPTPPERKEYSA